MANIIASVAYPDGSEGGAVTKQTLQNIDANFAVLNAAAAPGGNNTDIQFNDNGVFGGQDDFSFDKTTGALSFDGASGGKSQILSLSGGIAEIETVAPGGLTRLILDAANGAVSLVNEVSAGDITVEASGDAILTSDSAAVVVQGNASGNLKFFGAAAGAGLQTVTGSKGGNAALASLISALAAYGLIVDSTS